MGSDLGGHAARLISGRKGKQIMDYAIARNTKTNPFDHAVDVTFEVAFAEPNPTASSELATRLAVRAHGYSSNTSDLRIIYPVDSERRLQLEVTATGAVGTAYPLKMDTPQQLESYETKLTAFCKQLRAEINQMIPVATELLHLQSQCKTLTDKLADQTAIKGRDVMIQQHDDSILKQAGLIAQLLADVKRLKKQADQPAMFIHKVPVPDVFVSDLRKPWYTRLWDALKGDPNLDQFVQSGGKPAGDAPTERVRSKPQWNGRCPHCDNGRTRYDVVDLYDDNLVQVKKRMGSCDACGWHWHIDAPDPANPPTGGSNVNTPTKPTTEWSDVKDLDRPLHCEQCGAKSYFTKSHALSPGWECVRNYYCSPECKELEGGNS
jgi:hypothetical protein